MFTECYVLSYC